RALLDLFGNECVECGSQDNLEIHHLDPATKQFTLSEGWTRPWELSLEEIKGCQLLCKSCHMKRHATIHGKRRMYVLGCRCDRCRKANRVYMLSYKRRKRGGSSIGRASVFQTEG